MDIRDKQKKVAVDLDGTLHLYSKGWQGGKGIYDPPFEGAKEAMKRLRDKGVYIIIHTARIHESRTLDENYEVRQEIIAWLMSHDIPFDEIWHGQGKPIAHIYIDDRGLRFDPTNGGWATSVIQIEGLLGI